MIRTLKLKLTRAALPLFALLFAFSSLAQDLKVVTFNTWGVPFAAKDKWRYRVAMNGRDGSDGRARIDGLAQMSPDIVFLQEVFGRKGKRKFKNKKIFPYWVDGPRAFPKLINSGLRILSKYPIESYAQLVYKNCQKDDCLSRKGAVLAVIRLPDGRKITAVNTHLNARGGEETRQAQIRQLRTFVEYYREPGTPLLVAGDFNLSPETRPETATAVRSYDYLLSQLNVLDTWPATHAASEPGYTNDTDLNRYARDYSIRYRFPLGRERIDYLLTRQMRPLSSRLIFNEGTLLSDHFGIAASFDLEAVTAAEPARAPDPSGLSELEVVTEGAESDDGIDDDEGAPVPAELEYLLQD